MRRKHHTSTSTGINPPFFILFTFTYVQKIDSRHYKAYYTGFAGQATRY